MGFFKHKRKKRKAAFTVLVIRPSKYDDEGYVIRYLKGVLPSNTIAVLSGLTRDVFDSGRFGDGVETRIVPLDDSVQAIRVDRLARKYLGKNRRAVVVFAGVQSNQFPRSADLALRFKKAGFEVMIGGFHVSGAIAMSKETPPECQALMDRGVTLVKGEVEDVWGDLLEDAWLGHLKPFYDILEKPDIRDVPVPLLNPRYQKHFVYPNMGTVDASRGCPYTCSFCTIINVQGRRMRCRSAESIVTQVEENFRLHKVDYYFFTDANFSRNKNWEAIFDGLIALREEKNISVDFMMQVDAKAWKMPRFVEKAVRAGCTQVFLGIESLNPDNLKAVDKNQNVVGDMAEMVETWHRAGCACHASYIIGFPFDSPESVARDVQSLKDTGFDQCSFFMLTPLPGSADHSRMIAEGQWLDPDYNNYDSYHEALDLPLFKKGEWYRTYLKAWDDFCNFEYTREVLSRCNPRTYWGLFKNYMWYKSALFDEIHPMVSGLWRCKPRIDRRPGYAVEGRLKHFFRRLRESHQTLRSWTRLYFELQELWLQTRIRPESSPGYLKALRERLGGNVEEWTESIGAKASEMRERLGENVEEWTESLGARASEMRRSIEERRAQAREWIQDSAAEMHRSIEERGAQAREWIQGGASEFSTRVRTRFTQLHRYGKSIHGRVLNRLLSRALVRLNSVGKRRLVTTRSQLNTYWARTRLWIREKRVFRLSIETPRIGLNALREARLSATFMVYFLHELTCE